MQSGTWRKMSQETRLSRSLLPLMLASAALALAGCQHNPLRVSRSQCPAVAVPAYAGSVTLFNPPQSRDAAAIDLTAQLTDLRGDCVDGAESLSTDVSFQVTAQRRHAGAAREVYLPIFVALAQGGNVLVSKQQTGVLLKFDANSLRAQAAGSARAEVARAATTLPTDIQERLAKKRRPDEQDALIDPRSDPRVKAAIRAATFEVLVGFQLDDPSLAYNVGK